LKSQEKFYENLQRSMTSNPVCCLPDEPVDQVAQMMASEGIGAIPVIENREDHRLIGILTDRDLTIESGRHGSQSCKDEKQGSDET
jgi:CBS domain-containing protein